MFKTTILTTVALFGLAAAPAAQVRVDAQLGRRVNVGVEVGDSGVGFHGGYHIGRSSGRTFRTHRHTGGYWKTITERVCVPGYYETVVIPAQYGWIYDSCGRRYWGVIQPACEKQIWHPERWECRTRRVWCPY